MTEMIQDKVSHERCGEAFDENVFLGVRELSRKAIYDVLNKLHSGLKEKEIVEMLDQTLFAMEAERLWHPTKVRIEKSTVKSFPETFDGEKTLEDGDLIFFDVGPVFNEHEGDYGETFIFAEEKKNDISHYAEKKQLVKFSKDLFHILKKEFKENHLTGVALYQRAVELSREVGLEFNLRMGGHRLGDFPHALYSKGKLKDMDFEPKSGLWILEIHVINRSVGLGAFFEDLI